MDLTPPRVQRSVGIVQTVEKRSPFRRLAMRASTLLLVLCLVVTPLCASWCAAAPCHPSLSSSNSEACHHGGNRHAENQHDESGSKAMAKEITCPAGEYFVASRNLSTLSLSSSFDSKAPHSAGFLSGLTAVRQTTSDDSPGAQRRSQPPLSMLSDLRIPLRI